MNKCPNCLANNSFTKVQKDGSVIEICEYCNTINEVTTVTKAIITPENKPKGTDPVDTVVHVVYFFFFVFIFCIIILLLDQ
jgi:hypothetical protein